MVTIIKAKDLKMVGVLNMLVYGQPGAGKTTFAATAPKPLIIDIEGGCISIMDTEADIIQAKTIDDIRESINLAVEKGYKTVVIDSLTRYSDVLMAEILENDDKSNGQPKIANWGELIQRIKKMTWFLQDKNINVIFTAHEKEATEEDSTIKRPNLPGQLASVIPGIVDATGYLAINNNGERELNLIPTSKYYAKVRTTVSNRITGPVAPDFTLMLEKIFGKKTVVKEAK